MAIGVSTVLEEQCAELQNSQTVVGEVKMSEDWKTRKG